MEIIKREFVRAKAKNSSFSQRGLAKRLGLSSGALTDLLKGKRRVSLKLAERILLGLNVNPKEQKEIIESISTKKPKPIKAFQTINLDQFEIVAEIEHFAILSLMNTSNFNSSPDWIAKRLNISTQKVNQAIDRLERVGLITRKGNELIRNSPATQTPDNIASNAIKHANRQGLHRAEQAIDLLTPDDRDITTFITVGSAADLIKVRAKIREMQNEISHLLDNGDRTDVYQLSIQFFPLTNNKQRNSKK